MPLTLRSAGLASAAYRDWLDYVIVEGLMTWSTSAVAVCCCRYTRSSLSSRAFSIAMTACLAKLL